MHICSQSLEKLLARRISMIMSKVAQ
ncbi:MAG: hypothetical protein V4736_09190, partial [Bdellovibrionota bacterium]